MFVRRLVFSLFLGALVAGVTVAVAGAGGFKIPGFIDPIPGIVNAPLPLDCQVHEGTVQTEVDCTATEPNPNPPKDTKTIKFSFSNPKGSCTIKAYPDGGVTETCRIKGPLEV